MSSHRTANWVSRTTPGAPPPPPSHVQSRGPPPTIYPESSVSNPNASRYTGRPSRPRSNSHYSSSHSHARSHSMGPSPVYYPPPPPSSRHHSRPASAMSHRSSQNLPIQTYQAQTAEPIIARTSSASGRTNSYMIIPPAGQKVEILHPNPVRSYSSPTTYTTTTTSHKERPLIKRLFDKVEWNDSAAGGKSSASRTVTRISRRNSTGGSTVIVPGGTRITTGGGSQRSYSVHYV